MESLIEQCFEQRIDFELFKSNVCRELKNLGDIPFINDLLEKDEISTYFHKNYYPECLYLLAMLDYLSRINQIPVCNKYDDLRKLKLKNTIYPASILAIEKVTKDSQIKKQALKDAIPEFLKFNIVESEIRNVI